LNFKPQIMRLKIVLWGLFMSIQFSNSYSQDNYFKAIEKGNLELFNKELSEGMDINYQRKKDQLSPLLLASITGKTEFVKVLLEKGANLELVDNNDKTALLCAINQNHLDIAVMLMSNGAKTSVKNISGYSALHYCCKTNNTKNKDKHDIQMKIMSELISSGVSVNDVTNNGTSPFLIACENGDLEIIEFLIKKNADINKKSAIGLSPLCHAVIIGNQEVAEVLLDNGADINVKCQNECTPLILSILEKKFNVAEYLISRNADVAYITSTGFSALKASVILSNKALVEDICNIMDLTLDLDSEYDNEIVASSIAFSNDNSIFALMTEKEKNFKLASENKRLSDSLSYDTVKSKYYSSQQIRFLEESYNCYSKREKEYRKQADKISAVNALKVVAIALSPSPIFWVVSPFELENTELLYKIADKYKAQMSYLKATINIEKLKL
jgi:ankyrin repeat protein